MFDYIIGIFYSLFKINGQQRIYKWLCNNFDVCNYKVCVNSIYCTVDGITIRISNHLKKFICKNYQIQIYYIQNINKFIILTHNENETLITYNYIQLNHYLKKYISNNKKDHDTKNYIKNYFKDIKCLDHKNLTCICSYIERIYNAGYIIDKEKADSIIKIIEYIMSDCQYITDKNTYKRIFNEVSKLYESDNKNMVEDIIISSDDTTNVKDNDIINDTNAIEYIAKYNLCGKNNKAYKWYKSLYNEGLLQNIVNKHLKTALNIKMYYNVMCKAGISEEIAYEKLVQHLSSNDEILCTKNAFKPIFAEFDTGKLINELQSKLLIIDKNYKMDGNVNLNTYLRNKFPNYLNIIKTKTDHNKINQLFNTNKQCNFDKIAEIIYNTLTEYKTICVSKSIYKIIDKQIKSEIDKQSSQKAIIEKVNKHNEISKENKALATNLLEYCNFNLNVTEDIINKIYKYDKMSNNQKIIINDLIKYCNNDIAKLNAMICAINEANKYGIDSKKMKKVKDKLVA